MPIYKSSQQLPEQPVIVLLIGDPGTAKTSLSNTCKNPLNVDFDLGFKRSYGRPDSLQPTGWGEVMQIIESAEIDQYDTIVIDTAKGALDDFCMVYVQEKDYKLKTNKLKAYGEIGDQFKLMINILRRKGKDIFIIAHSKQTEDGDIKKNVADITGQSSALLLRIADQVGYLTIRNGQRVVSFNPTDTTIGKNVANLPDVSLPAKESADWKLFADREIIQKVKDSLSAMDENQKAALQLIADWHTKIDVVVADDTALKAINKEVSEIPQEHIKLQIRKYLSAHVKKVGMKWDAKAVKFVPINEETAPPVEETKAADPVEGQQTESNAAGLFDKKE